MVRDGRLKAPIVIGRDHLDAGSVASPYRETEGMLDGSDAVSDWALLNFATGIASGAAWMSFHHGGGVGMGYSQHAGLVAVADGSEEANQRLRLPTPRRTRHADAGFHSHPRHSLSARRCRANGKRRHHRRRMPDHGAQPRRRHSLRRPLIDAGVSIALGTDSHTQTDALENARELESNLRLRHLQRAVLDGRQGRPLASLLFDSATVAGARSLHLEAGSLHPGHTR